MVSAGSGLALWLAGGWHVPALAGEEPFFSELPIVASISRLSQRQVDAPTAVTVIDRATIRASGARTLSDVLRLVPGFQTFASSDVAARVNYHGITDEDFSPRVQVLVDGRSLHSPLFRNGMNWALVPVALKDIERIEAVRGSNTTSFGTNAFLGVINIVTVDPALVRGGMAVLSAGNQGIRDLTLRGGAALGEAGNVRITYQHQQDDGLDERPNEQGVHDWADHNRLKRLDLRLNQQLDPRTLLQFGLGRVEGTRLTGRLDRRSGLPRQDDPLRTLEESSTWMQLHWLRTLSERSDLSLRYTFSEDRGDASFINPDPAVRPYPWRNPQGDRGSRHELEATHTVGFADARLVWGGSWRSDRFSSRSLMVDQGRVTRDVGRVFANAEWRPVDGFTGNAGLSHEYDSLAGDHLAPRVSAAFHLDDSNSVRIGYARAWRTASVPDYRAREMLRPDVAEWLGNPALPAERLDSWELGYLGDWRDWRMSLDARLFLERLRNRAMNQIRTGASFGLANAPYTVEALQNIDMKGFELQWKWQPHPHTKVMLGHAHIHIDSENTGWGQVLAARETSNFHTSQQRYVELAERSAPHRASSLLLMQHLPFGADLSLAWYRVGAIKWTRNTQAPGYDRVDARLAYPFRLGAQRGELAYTVQSLGGAHFEQREQRVVDRRHWISLRVEY